MRALLGLAVFCAVAVSGQMSNAAVFRAWIDPSITSAGWTHEEVKSGILRGCRSWERICNIRFDFVDRQIEADIMFRSDALYQPDGSPHGGYCKGNVIWLNNGLGADRTGGTAAWHRFGSLDELARVVAHEIGHFLGMKHTMHRESLMHPSAPVWFSSTEEAWARRRFGVPVTALRLDRLPTFRGS